MHSGTGMACQAIRTRMYLRPADGIGNRRNVGPESVAATITGNSYYRNCLIIDPNRTVR